MEVCADAQNDFGIKHVHVPDVSFAGNKLHVSVKQVPVMHVDKGFVRAELQVAGVKVAHQFFELCDTTECDVKPHIASWSKFALDIPEYTPENFDTTLRIMVNDHNGKQLSCVEVDHITLQKSGDSEGRKLGAQVETAQGLVSLTKTELEFLFGRWAKEFGMVFAENDIKDRMRVFADNLEKIVVHNAAGNTYKMGMNQFGHLTLDEFRKTRFGYRADLRENSTDRSYMEVDQESLSERSLAGIPDEVDWSKKGAVTPVKNQGSCGSCWSFSTTGGLEGAYFLKTGKLVSFSEQELVSCDKVDQGCNGGLMDNADKFIEKAGGLCSEDDYPYVSGSGRSKRCDTSCTPVAGSQIKSYFDVPHKESALEEAVAKQPVSIAIEADQLAFQFYRKGVMTGRCGSNLDHGVLVVGYGTLNGVKYWKVKNSWGPTWGSNGYILFVRGKARRGGECGILLSASYPIL